MLDRFAPATRRAPLTLGLLFVALSLLPAPHASGADSAERQQAAALTEQLLHLQQRLDHAASAERPQLLRQLQQQAARRQSLLAELAGRDPAAALRASLPERVQNSLPREVLAQVERPLQVEGTLEVSYEDHADGSHRLRHFLNTPFGERFELSFAKDAPHRGNGKPVRLQGVLFDQPSAERNGVVVLEDGDSSLVWLDNAGSATALSGDIAPAVEYSLGEQKTLMILVNFSDNTAQPATPAEARGMLDTLDAYIRENSAGRSWLSGTVAGWYTIALSGSVCDSYSLRNQAQDAARLSGYTLANYDRLIYVYPKNACGYAGSASVGGKPTDTYINGQFDLHNLAHEFGHNLGLDHAHALECGATTLGSSCSSVVYGDSMDVLGKNNGSEGHYNPFNKERLGWLKASEVLSVGASGRFDLLPYADLAGSGVRVLKVAKPDTPSDWYYVGFHQPVGFEARLLDGSNLNVANVTNGVVVHRAGSNAYSDLLDMTPGTGGSVSDWLDPALEQGRSFSDSSAGVTLTTSWVDAQKAQVDVQFSGSASCVQNAPSVQVGAPVTQWGSAGQTLTYQVQLTSNDSGACSGRSFNLQASQPSGWNKQFASASLSLAPGQTASTSLAVTSASSAAAAYYDLSVATSQAPTSSATLTYVVETGAGNTAPLAVDDQVGLTSIAPVTIAVLANDSDPEGDKLNIVTLTQGSKGAVRLNGDGSLTYSPAKGFKSTDQFRYTVSDGQNTASATVYLSLQSTSGGGSTGGGKGNR